MNSLTDTIAAISTPIARGAIGMVRLSGSQALTIADKIFLPKDKSLPSGCKTHTVHYGWIIERNQKPVTSNQKKPETSKNRKEKNKIIDEVLLTVMRSPKTYTKEDIVEISCHSGLVVLRQILEAVLSAGARMAGPGEFTKRAFLNGRIDLAQAQAVIDIINAKTSMALESSLGHLAGAFSRKIGQIQEEILRLHALLEAGIDFPEDVEALNLKKVKNDLNKISLQIRKLIKSFSRGKVLRDGIRVVIAGRANVGKSSLLNTLLKQERAIVSPVAGTTRDTIEEIMDLRGIPLKIADTAGIIEPKDIIEEEAMRRQKENFENADLLLLTFDAGLALTKDDRVLLKKAKARNAIAVINKSDLKARIETAQVRKYIKRIVKISCLKLTGFKALEDEIEESVWEDKAARSYSEGGIVVTCAMHAQALEKAGEALNRVNESINDRLPVEFMCEDLRLSREHLGEITGEADSPDVLDRIFSEFCIGK